MLQLPCSRMIPSLLGCAYFRMLPQFNHNTDKQKRAYSTSGWSWTATECRTEIPAEVVHRDQQPRVEPLINVIVSPCNLKSASILAWRSVLLGANCILNEHLTELDERTTFPSPKQTRNQKPRLRFPDLANLRFCPVKISIGEVLHHVLHLNLENAACQLIFPPRTE